MELGFVGVGQMGQPMAHRLLDAGHRLVVHDVRNEATAPLVERQCRPAASARGVADAAEIVFASLPTLDAYREIALGRDGVIHGRTARVFVNLGTVGSSLVRDLAERLGKASIVTIDCPISGGPAGAAAGTLSVMVSGPQAVFREVEPLLATFGKVTYAGDRVGLAQSLKLANNVLSATALTATSEALVMGVKAGLDPEIMLQAINGGSGRNSATLEKIPRNVLTRDFAFGATLDIMIKDVDLALAEGEALGVPMQVCQSVRQLLRIMKAQLGGQRDITEIARQVATWADAEIPKTR